VSEPAQSALSAAGDPQPARGAGRAVDSTAPPVSWRAVLVALLASSVVMLLPELTRLALLGQVPASPLDILLVPPWILVEAGAFTAVLRWGERRRASVSGMLIAAYAVAAAVGAISLVGYGLASGDPALRASSGVVTAITDGAGAALLIVGVWTLFYATPRAVARARASERAHQELLRELERARVRATLEPHFVLNTLNAIGSLVGDDPERARELIGDLGELLRDAVRLAARDRHPARDEVAWLARYVRVLEARHPGRLGVSWRVDPTIEDWPMPVLLLQPLVENAIHHGALGRAAGGRVAIALERVAGALRCTISDDGCGLGAGPTRPGAQGIALTRRRLACDAPGATLALRSGSAGTSVVVELPREAT
jgi:hypothetical protein